MNEHAGLVGIGLKLSRGAPIGTFRRVWRIAEEAGFDHCWAFDHLVTTGPSHASMDLSEGWTLLAAMAEATSRVRIGLLVTGMVYRHTAHQVGRLSEGLQLIKMLWMGQRSDFAGRYYRLRDAVADPKPLQEPHPPIWVGASGPAMLQLVARHADVWNWAGDSLADAVAAGRELMAACHQIGRDPAGIRWSAQFAVDPADPATTIRELREWHQAGFTELVLSCPGPGPEQAAEVAAEKILPVARQLG